MVSAAIAAFGTQLQVDDGGGVNYTSIAELKDVSGPQLSADTVPVTNHASPGAFEELIPTILHQGQITFSINYVPTGATHNAATGLVYLLKNKLKRSFKVIFPDTTAWISSGYVTGFQPTEPVAGALTAAITIRPTGLPTLA